MHTARPHLSKSRCLLFFALLAFPAALCLGTGVAFAQESNELLPLSQVRAGMQGYAYTIFGGDQVEKFNLEVIGVLDNFLGPKQSIILVQLKGPKVEHTGVVAGMSGSPVYLDGKLAGALSLKLGIFTKEPMAGVVLVQGDASINSACTVTAVQADRVYLCGHPFLSLGDIQIPMPRSRAVTTLSSELASTKIVNVGGSIGTITGDHLTAVTGK